MAGPARPIENYSTNEISPTVQLGIPVKLNARSRGEAERQMHLPGVIAPSEASIRL